jgi:germ cell nuclear acidic protein
MKGIGGDSGSESDEAFPSVGELSRTAKGTANKTIAMKGNRDVKSPVKKIGGRKEALEGEKEDAGRAVGNGRVVGKKRVLGQRSDNPLLRPFDSASSELLGEASKRKGKAVGVKMGKKLVEENAHVLGKRCCEGRERLEEGEETPMGSIGSNDDNVRQARRFKNQPKATQSKQSRERVDEDGREGKPMERSRSTPTEATEPEDVEEFQARRIMKRKQDTKRRSDQEKDEYTPQKVSTAKFIESGDGNSGQTKKTTRGKQVRKVIEKTRSRLTLKYESNEEDFDLDSDGMSDFIVNDSESLEEEDSIIEKPAPRSVRRLIKGRRPTRVEDSDDENLDLGRENPKVDEPSSTSLNEALKKLYLDDSDDVFLQTKPRRRSKGITTEASSHLKNEDGPLVSSDIEEQFTLR